MNIREYILGHSKSFIFCSHSIWRCARYAVRDQRRAETRQRSSGSLVLNTQRRLWPFRARAKRLEVMIPAFDHDRDPSHTSSAYHSLHFREHRWTQCHLSAECLLCGISGPSSRPVTASVPGTPTSLTCCPNWRTTHSTLANSSLQPACDILFHPLHQANSPCSHA